MKKNKKSDKLMVRIVCIVLCVLLGIGSVITLVWSIF